MDSLTFEVQSLFYQSAYRGCIALAQMHSPSGPIDDESLLRLVYAARSALALGDIPGARQLLGDDAEQPVAMSVLLLADFMEMHHAGDEEGSADVLEQMATLLDVVEPGELASDIVRYNVGLALYTKGDSTKALETLGVTGTGGSTKLECISLGVHILLAIHRVDLAEKEYLAARQWGDDSVLVQYMEAWIGLVRGGRSTQQAFYVYDEMSQSSTIANTQNMAPALIGKAVAQAAQLDVPAASSTLQEAASLDADHPLLSANQAVVSALATNVPAEDVDGWMRYVHQLCTNAQRTYQCCTRLPPGKDVGGKASCVGGGGGVHGIVYVDVDFVLVYVPIYLQNHSHLGEIAHSSLESDEGGCICERRPDQRRLKALDETARTAVREYMTDHIKRVTEAALARVHRVGLHVRLDHINGVNHKPQHNASCTACQHRSESRQLLTRQIVGVQLLLHEILVRQEVDTHTMTFTKDRRTHPAEHARNAGVGDDSVVSVCVYVLLQAIKRTTNRIALLGLEANTNLFDRTCQHTVRYTTHYTGCVQLGTSELLDRRVRTLVLVGKHTLKVLHHTKLNRHTGTYTDQRHERALVKRHRALTLQNVGDTVHHTYHMSGRAHPIHTFVCARRRRLNANLHNIERLAD